MYLQFCGLLRFKTEMISIAVYSTTRLGGGFVNPFPPARWTAAGLLSCAGLGFPRLPNDTPFPAHSPHVLMPPSPALSPSSTTFTPCPPTVPNLTTRTYLTSHFPPSVQVRQPVRLPRVSDRRHQACHRHHAGRQDVRRGRLRRRRQGLGLLAEGIRRSRHHH